MSISYLNDSSNESGLTARVSSLWRPDPPLLWPQQWRIAVHSDADVQHKKDCNCWGICGGQLKFTGVAGTKGCDRNFYDYFTIPDLDE